MELILQLWPIFAGVTGGLIGLVVWSIRLEAGMLANRKDIRRLEVQREKDNERADAHRDKIDRKLDHISDRLGDVLLRLGDKEDRK